MKNDENSVNLSRRDFFKELGMIGGGGVLLSAFPWLQSCSADDKVQIAKEKVRIGFIGTGSRGQYHLNNLKTIPYADVDRKSTRLNSSHYQQSRMPSSA